MILITAQFGWSIYGATIQFATVRYGLVVAVCICTKHNTRNEIT